MAGLEGMPIIMAPGRAAEVVRGMGIVDGNMFSLALDAAAITHHIRRWETKLRVSWALSEGHSHYTAMTHLMMNLARAQQQVGMQPPMHRRLQELVLTVFGDAPGHLLCARQSPVRKFGNMPDAATPAATNKRQVRGGMSGPCR